MLTAYGTLSRNMTVGLRLGKGEKLVEILKTSKGIVEGIPTLEAVLRYSHIKNIEMPIFELFLVDICNNDKGQLTQ